MAHSIARARFNAPRRLPLFILPSIKRFCIVVLLSSVPVIWHSDAAGSQIFTAMLLWRYIIK